MKTATARKAPAKTRKPAPRKKVRQVGIMDRLLRILPFTEEDIQRVVTWVVVATDVFYEQSLVLDHFVNETTSDVNVFRPLTDRGIFSHKNCAGVVFLE